MTIGVQHKWDLLGRISSKEKLNFINIICVFKVQVLLEANCWLKAHTSKNRMINVFTDHKQIGKIYAGRQSTNFIHIYIAHSTIQIKSGIILITKYWLQKKIWLKNYLIYICNTMYLGRQSFYWNAIIKIICSKFL